jgi:outer membrane lipopolysaccharide assembly protein LptE/RlpB
MMAMSKLKMLYLLFPLLLLSACGFQPRGESARPAASISPVFIAGLPARNPFVKELRHQLQVNGVSLAVNRDQAVTVLRLGKLDRKRRVFSVNANNKVVEYEIRRKLSFSVERPPGTKVLSNQELSTKHIVYDPGGELLGRTREAELRTADSYRELAQQLINYLSKVQ